LAGERFVATNLLKAYAEFQYWLVGQLGVGVDTAAGKSYASLAARQVCFTIVSNGTLLLSQSQLAYA
jgi:hypothetical protein